MNETTSKTEWVVVATEYRVKKGVRIEGKPQVVSTGWTDQFAAMEWTLDGTKPRQMLFSVITAEEAQAAGIE